jgi:creatinine amidohydrolase
VKLKSHFWWDYSTRMFAGLDMSRIVAVQPVGAVEQHGPHLPVRVDAAINAAILERAVALMTDELPALVLPMMPVGKSDEHAAFPGTLTLSYDTLTRVWFELGESVHRAGCRKIIFFNSHGGQPQIAQIVCRELRVKLGMLAVDCMWSRTIDKSDLFVASELKHGIHGGEVETSIMLHLRPDLVDMGLAKNFAPLSLLMEREGSLLTPEGAVGFGWQAQDLEPSGACGNAASADARRGAVLVERAAEALMQLIREVVQFPLERLGRRPSGHD